MKYVDVILPLPLDGVFTYSLPATLENRVVVGARVSVPLGKSKHYVAIVYEIHERKPSFDVRDVTAVLDETPVLLPQQLALWRWMADYYCCSLGDVFKAAMPADLRDEDGWRPKTETYVGLTPTFRNELSIRRALQMLGRSPRKLQVFQTYLSLSGWFDVEGTTPPKNLREVTKEELMNESHSTAAHVNSLITQHLIFTYEKEVSGALRDTVAERPLKALSDAQATAKQQIENEFQQHDVVLLHGVTSSGKTEIYIHLISELIAQGKQVLYLLPEIALTVQMMQRLREVFGDALGIYHSRYSDRERADIWQKQLSDHPYQVILAARSGIFLPFRDLGMIICDEEHETSFKQQDPAPRYHARSAAIMLAQFYGAKTLLGTATPALETFYNCVARKKFGLVELTTRYSDIELPEIQVVDVKDLRHRKIMKGPISPALRDAMREALDNDRQVILFQNRRGFAPMFECHTCGWVPRCERCDVPLTLHKTHNRLVCHYCGSSYVIPQSCPACGETDLRTRGYGTEKIEEEINALFPEARIARMDLDTTRTRNAYERLINDFSAGKTNVLIGTQMVSKGLDFARVQVVGILDADGMLNYPDFRATEHAFMMMLQVSGRAGRKGQRGKVILQTRSKDLPVIGQVVKNDYKSFYKMQLDERRLFHYPPFVHLIYIYMKHSKSEIVDSAAVYMGSMLREWFGDRVLGPDKPAVARVKNMYLRKIVLKLENNLSQRRVREYLHLAQKKIMEDPRNAALHIYFDVDPL